jgi:glycosyltransferase involved in cell wall biosynthesis
MIIKNEGPLLGRLFDSVKGFVKEYCIVDTGSTDQTINVLKSMDIPGTIFEEAFVDFGTTRNVLLQKCREKTTCDYLLLLDADMILCQARNGMQRNWTLI